VNSNRQEKQVYIQVLVGCLLCLFLTGVFFVITFRRPSVLGLGISARVSGTRTALALTSNALYGPFPTATGPTPTASKTRTITPTPTLTPSDTPTPTPLRFFIDTATPRTLVPRSESTPILATNPPIQPTAPAVQPTNPPVQPTPCVNPQGHPIPCH
jgi:hypothetical protein